MKRSEFTTRYRKAMLGVTLFTALTLASAPSLAQESAKLEQISSFLSMASSFYDLMESVHEAARDPEMAALIQMHEIQEIYKNRGELRAVIPVYEGVLAKSENPTIRALAYQKLADTMKKLGETDRAITLLERGLQESIERADSMPKQ